MGHMKDQQDEDRILPQDTNVTDNFVFVDHYAVNTQDRLIWVVYK